MDVAKVTDCPVCFGTFKDPRVLPCGHTFCLSCITEHGRSKGSDPGCPNCRTKFQIPSSGFKGLPKNYSLNSVLYETTSIVDASKAKVRKGSCKKHTEEELVLYCVQCNIVICLDCMEDDHQKHDCRRISRFAKEARAQLEGYVNSIKPILSQVTSQKAQLQEKSKKFCDLLDVTELAINEEYEKNKRLLDDHRRLLLEELSNEKQRVTKDLKMKTDEIETEQLSLASFNTRIEEMLQGTDEATAFDMVCQYKDFKDSFYKLKQIQPQAMAQVSSTGIEFIPGDFKEFISKRGNMIGRLQMESESRPKVERSRTVRRDFITPSSTQVDHTLLQRFPIDQHVWYYLRRKHQDKLDCIAQQHLCIMKVVCDSSNEEIAHSLEVVPYYQDDSNEASKHVDDAIDVFGQLYQKVSEPGIVKESIKLPLAFNQGMPQQLIAELEEMGVFLLRSDDPCLIGSRVCIQEAKHRVSDFISGRKYSASEVQPTDNFGLVQASATVGTFTFKTRCGLTIHVSKGIFGVPIEIVGRASFEALIMFDAACKKKRLHEIHFINKDEATASNMKRIFQSLVTHKGIKNNLSA